MSELHLISHRLHRLSKDVQHWAESLPAGDREDAQQVLKDLAEAAGAFNAIAGRASVRTSQQKAHKGGRFDLHPISDAEARLAAIYVLATLRTMIEGGLIPSRWEAINPVNRCIQALNSAFGFDNIVPEEVDA